MYCQWWLVGPYACVMPYWVSDGTRPALGRGLARAPYDAAQGWVNQNQKLMENLNDARM